MSTLAISLLGMVLCALGLTLVLTGSGAWVLAAFTAPGMACTAVAIYRTVKGQL